MASPRPLPDDLLSRCVTRAELASAGVTEHELRGPLWRREFQGRHVWAARSEDVRTRIRDAAELLPAGAAIGGWAAAHLLGAEELDGQVRRHGGVVNEPVPLVVGRHHPVRRQRGAVLWSTPLDGGDVIEIDGVPVTAPDPTALDLARVRASSRSSDHLLALMRAVADVDALLRTTGRGPGDVLTYIERHRRWRGLPFAREVLALADPRVASRPESALRVVWTVEAGLPKPRVNWPVLTMSGRQIGIVDLLCDESALVAEYDGAGHRELDRHTADNSREEDLERHGLRVVRATSLDLYRSRARLVARLRTAHAEGLRRDRSQDNWLLGRVAV